MAAFGILAALRERERSGEGQLVDVSMTDGALSWLAMVAARVPRRWPGAEARRGDAQRRRRLLPARTSAPTAGSAAARWSRSSGSALCDGRRPPGPDRAPVRAARARTGHAAVAEVFAERTRDEWAAFNDEHDCCIEPVLDLDEALDSELVRAREMVVEIEQPELGPVRLLGLPVKFARTPADPTRPAPALGEHTEDVLAAAGFEPDEIAALLETGAVGGLNAEAEQPPFPVVSTPNAEQPTTNDELLKISELAERADVPVATVRHYLREGLLPEPVKTSRNMAYYPPEFVERIRLIKQLQEERFMPLRVIRELLEAANGDVDRLRAIIDDGDALAAVALGKDERTTQEEVLRRFELPERALVRLAELGVLTPNDAGYSPADVRILEAIARFRAAGWNETTGFGARDVARLMAGLEPVIADELALLMERFSALGRERAAAIVEGGAAPFPALIGALHAKLLTAELERVRGDG